LSELLKDLRLGGYGLSSYRKPIEEAQVISKKVCAREGDKGTTGRQKAFIVQSDFTVILAVIAVKWSVYMP
jgi:hypothetical protein